MHVPPCCIYAFFIKFINIRLRIFPNYDNSNRVIEVVLIAYTPYFAIIFKSDAKISLRV